MGFRDRLFVAYAGHVYGSTGTDHIRYGATGASEALIGIAIGIYGLAQAIFQIPFGLLSDRIGRKPLIVGGLAVFVAGSVIAALSHSIWGIILGRALQGPALLPPPSWRSCLT